METNLKIGIMDIASQAVLYQDNFDRQPNWKTSFKYGQLKSADLPTGWDYGRTGESWHPDFGDIGSMPSLMINGGDLEQVYGGSGKALVSYSESFFNKVSNGFGSDGFLTKFIEPRDEVYVSFKIKFQKGFAADFGDKTALVKLFRILSYDGTGSRSKFFSSGNSSPIYLYEWGNNAYGVRHNHAFRCDPQETAYYCKKQLILRPLRNVVQGAMSANYTSDLKAFKPHPLIPDLLDGGLLPKQGKVKHEQVFSDKWHELAFFVKLNSSPGVQDGIMKHWFDGKLIVNMSGIPWISSGGDMNAKWNTISFGGNDYFHFNMDETAPFSERERWYAIDDVKILGKEPKR